MRHVTVIKHVALGLVCAWLLTGCALWEKDLKDLLPEYTDSGIIGEHKTRVAKPTPGPIFYYKAGASLVTPIVAGDEALFGGEFGGDFTLRYAFRFTCLGWSYNVTAYWLNRYTKYDSGWLVNLESPDKRTRVNVKIVDVPLSSSFYHPLTEEQIQQERAAQDRVDREDQKLEAEGIIVASRTKSPYPDPLNREERILAGKEVIRRLLDKGVEGSKVADVDKLNYTSETVAHKEFVRGEADFYRGTLKKKVVIWALNIGGYRLKDAPDERRAETWVCEVISDPTDFASVEGKAGGILETLKFPASDINIYPDLRDSAASRD